LLEASKAAPFLDDEICDMKGGGKEREGRDKRREVRSQLVWTERRHIKSEGRKRRRTHEPNHPLYAERRRERVFFQINVRSYSICLH